MAKDLKNLNLKKILIPPHPLTSLEIQMYCQNESKFNGLYARDNLPGKIKDGTHAVNLDEYSEIENYFVAEIKERELMSK